MATTSFDPLATARDLEAAGIEHDQAAAIATALRNAATADRDQLATKTDIRWILTILSFQSAIILTMAARLFDIV